MATLERVWTYWAAWLSSDGEEMPESVRDPKAAFLAFLAEGHFAMHPNRDYVARLRR